MEAVVRPYFDGNEPFPDRTHINVIAARLQLETARLQAVWAEHAVEAVEKWHNPAEGQDHASELAALKAEIAAGAP